MGPDTGTTRLFSLFEQSIRYLTYCSVQAVDIRKTSIQIGGLIAAGIIQTVFSTISSKIPTIDAGLRMVGYFLACIPILLAMTASTALFLSGETDKDKHTVSAVFSYIRSRVYDTTVLLAQVFVVIIGLFAILVISDLLVKIPYLGELLWPLVYVINLLIAVAAVAVGICIVIGVHVLPASLALVTDNHNLLKKNALILKQTFPDWIVIFTVSTVSASVVFGIYIFITSVSMTLSRFVLAEKFYSLISAIPLYPGYLLTFLTGRFLPFDFVHQPRWTLSLGAFIWSLMIYVLLCVVMAVLLNMLSFIGAIFLKPHISSSKS